MRRKIIALVLALTLGLFTYMCNEKDDGNGAGLLLLLLAGQSQSSGFFISIPNGVAK